MWLWLAPPQEKELSVSDRSRRRPSGVGGSERKPETPLPGGDGRRRRSVPRRRH